MRQVSISREAEVDIDLLADYTDKGWGSRQTDRYLGQLEDVFRLLAGNPLVGRSCDAIGPGLRRHEQGRHVVFYRLKPDGIRIVRVLHRQMIPVKAHFEPSGYTESSPA